MKSLFLAFILTATTFSSFAQAVEPALSNQHTLSIIKPDAVAANHIGEIVARFEKAGLRVAGIKMTLLSKEKAQEFYAVHKDRPFFNELTTFMSTGPVVAIVLAGDNAVIKNREIMGATDFKKAAPETIRAAF
ncbi:MAG TPA: nucleoside-diphosphate kinase, partial [Parachlamydiaceae bacterium]|nr:nucleoside-diphosphate kinase [Parachlamydiaceae bacterium]